MMFCSQIVQQMQQLRLWVPWVTGGYIRLFQPLLSTSVRLLFTFKNQARAEVERTNEQKSDLFKWLTLGKSLC
jgi:hypothetical protein